MIVGQLIDLICDVLFDLLESLVPLQRKLLKLITIEFFDLVALELMLFDKALFDALLSTFSHKLYILKLLLRHRIVFLMSTDDSCLVHLLTRDEKKK